jgi:hypothetical protein
VLAIFRANRCAEQEIVQRRSQNVGVKLLLEILLSIFLHPIAMILMWINLIARNDLTTPKKVVWFIVSIIWGLGPILYILVAEGTLW